MKRFLILLIGLTLFLAACGGEPDPSNNAEDNTENSTTESADIAEETTDETTNEADDMEVKSGPLTEVGQWTEEAGGTIVTLEKIVSLEETFDLTPIQLTIHDIKVINRDSEDNEENVIQVAYTSENNSDKEIMFYPIEVITTNTKKQIDVSLENMAEYVPSEYFGNIVQEGYIIVPYPDDITDLNSIKLMTGDVWDNNVPEKYHESETIEIVFE